MTSRETRDRCCTARCPPAARTPRRERLVEGRGGDVPAEHHRQVGEGGVFHWNPDGHPVQLAGQRGNDLAGGPGGAGGGRHDSGRRRPGAAQVLVRPVQQHLVAGVGVHRGHDPLLHAERVVQHLDHRECRPRIEGRHRSWNKRDTWNRRDTRSGSDARRRYRIGYRPGGHQRDGRALSAGRHHGRGPSPGRAGPSGRCGARSRAPRRVPGDRREPRRFQVVLQC